MYIHEAIAATTPQKPYITREAWERITSKPCASAVKIQPTNSPDCCIIESIFNANHCVRWHPTASDLLADDWRISS